MYYVILSEGSYSDYSPTYFVGEIEITDKEFQAKGEEVGDKLIAEFESFPQRSDTSGYSWDKNEMERYNPETDETIFSSEFAEKWHNQMTEWLHSKGYTELPTHIPEINVSYSEIPNSQNKRF